MVTQAGDTFPLPWEQVWWSSSPAFPASLWRPRTQYAFTDFRLVVRRHGRTVDELALDDILGVELAQAGWQRAAGISTVRVVSRQNGRTLALADIHQGPQLALLLQLRAAELLGDDWSDIDAHVFRRTLGPAGPPVVGPNRRLLLTATVAFALLFIGIARVRSGDPDLVLAVAYAADDPIAPQGERRSTEDIVAFMERDVMPFARRALAPLVGGADNVACETCHGQDAAPRGWRMPGVRALPEPGVRFAGLERARLWLDPQMRNAVYGYLADEDKQSVANYMRRVVMPGMAKLMKRPAYDFAQTYGYNRSQAAVGCYHCHLVE